MVIFPSAKTAGNLNVIVGWSDSTASPISVTDSAGNSTSEISHWFDQYDLHSFERSGSGVLLEWLDEPTEGKLHVECLSEPAAFAVGLQVSHGVRAQQRRKALCRPILKRLPRQKECQIIEGHLRPDHVHICIEIPPKHAGASVIGSLKGQSPLPSPCSMRDAIAP
jgi:hypothetical protein